MLREIVFSRYLDNRSLLKEIRNYLILSTKVYISNKYMYMYAYMNIHIFNRNYYPKIYFKIIKQIFSLH